MSSNNSQFEYEYKLFKPDLIESIGWAYEQLTITLNHDMDEDFRNKLRKLVLIKQICHLAESHHVYQQMLEKHEVNAKYILNEVFDSIVLFTSIKINDSVKFRLAIIKKASNW